MDGLGSKSQLDMARNVHDLGSINKMREAIASGDEDVLQEAAQQFAMDRQTVSDQSDDGQSDGCPTPS